MTMLTLNAGGLMHQRWKDVEPKLLNTPDPKPWAPEQARIELVDWADWVDQATPRLKKKLGDRKPRLPAVLKVPEWWRKEFGDRWDWAPEWLSTEGRIEVPWSHWGATLRESLKTRVVFDLSYWGIDRFRTSAKYRPAEFEGMAQSKREQVNQLSHDALNQRFMSFNALTAFDTLKALESFLKHKSCAQIYGDLDRLEGALRVLIPQAATADPSIYETRQMIAVGSFHTASTSLALAHSIRWTGDPQSEAAIAEWEAWKRKTKPAHWNWKDLPNRRKNLWGSNDTKPDDLHDRTDDFHDRMIDQAQLLPKKKELRQCAEVVEVVADGRSFHVNAERDSELAAKLEAHAADLERKHKEYMACANAVEKKKQKRPIEFSIEEFPNSPAAVIEWKVAKPSKALVAFWNEQLERAAAEVESTFTKDSKLGIEHTGFDELGNEELRSLKYRKSRAIPRYKDELVADLDKDEEDAEELPDEDAIPDEDTVESDVEEVEAEDDDADDSEEFESFSESGSETSEGTCYINDPRFSDDEDAAGPPEGHDHLVPIYEDNTRETHDPNTHEDLEAVRAHLKSKKWITRAPILYELICNSRTPEEALEIHNDKETNPKAVQKWKERFVEEAMILKERPSGRPDAEMTDDMLDDIKEGFAYVLVDLGNGWKYHRLDTETYADLGAAVQALKEEKIDAAWRESDVRKRTQKDFIGRKEVRRLELQKIREKFDERFKEHWVLRDPNQWPKSRNNRGLLGYLATHEGQE